jgi:hypothetical protein
MTTNQTDVESPAVVRGDDAYHLTPEGIKEPPQWLRSEHRLLQAGPDPEVSIVGSGELIATTT